MTILIVEDDPDTLDLISHIFNLTGRKHMKAKSTGSALSILRTVRPDIVLLDLIMNGEVAEDVIHYCKEKFIVPPRIIIMSAWRGCKEIAKKYGIHECLEKPFDIEKLEEILDKDEIKVDRMSRTV